MKLLSRVISAVIALSWRVPAWSALMRDTDLTCLTRLRRIVSDIHHSTAAGRSDWLSAHIESVRDLRRRREAGQYISIDEKLHRCLHRLHTLRASAAFAAILWIGLVGMALGYACATGRSEPPVRITNLAGTLTTVAEVLGGVAGILFAVIVFGIQFHGERLGDVSCRMSNAATRLRPMVILTVVGPRCSA